MLPPDPYAQQVAAQAVDTLYRGLPKLVGTALVPIAVIWVFWGYVDQTVLIGWGIFIYAASAATQILHHAYVRRAPALDESLRWAQYFTFALLANGLAWGMAGMLFFVRESAPLQVFLFVCIIGLCAGAISLLAYWLEGYYAFIIPAMTLSAARLFMEDGIEYQNLAVLVIIAMGVLMLLGRYTHQYVMQSIRQRFENLDLLEQLGVEKNTAETMSRDKTRFLASASHDLRQPIHALSLFSDALGNEMKDFATPKARLLFDRMGHSIQALNQLLGSLLDISKLDANIVQPHRIQFELSPMIDTLLAECALQAQLKGLVFTTHFEAGIWVDSDPVLLENMLRNLISNALRYTPSGSISITAARQQDAMVHIAVRDTGVGIPKEQQQEIFREFFQLANPERDRAKGLGLGLAIVERLANLLKHRIALESEPGKGSCFTIILPLATQAEAGDNTANAAMGPALQFDYSLSGLRVLVIDDESAIREGMAAVLASWDCQATLAGSAEEAVIQLGHPGSAQTQPHVIISDFRLRDNKTGAQAIEQIRARLGINIPALIITGDIAPEHLLEAQASGHTLMHKPVQPAKLRAYLSGIRRLETSLAP